MQFRDTVCPFCGYQHDSVTPTPGNDPTFQPEPGDLTLCIACGEFAIFALVPGGLRKPSDAEYLSFALEPEIQRIREAWVEVMRRKAAGEFG